MKKSDFGIFITKMCIKMFVKLICVYAQMSENILNR